MSHFQTTNWSLVLRARADDGLRSRHALEHLCRAYRAPVLSYIRQFGVPRDESEDLAQAFFARFLEHAIHAEADPVRGRFRALLLTALRHFLINAGDAKRAAKRGGGVELVGLEALESATGHGIDSPERAFELAWAVAVIERAMERLRDEARATGKIELFDRLREFLLEKPSASDYERVARELDVRPNTLAVSVHRWRTRLREQIRIELADTVTSDEDVEAELAVLRETIGAG